MRTMHTLAACSALTIAGAGLTLAATADTDGALAAMETETVEGRITRVDHDAKAFTLLVEQDPDGQNQPVRIPLAYTDDTVCTLDDREATPKEAIRAGYGAVVTHDEEVALIVEATRPKQPE